MWRDLNDDEIKYLEKVAIDLRKSLRAHAIVMIISYIVLFAILIITGNLRFEYLLDIIEFCAINPFMWIFMYVAIKISHSIRCVEEKGYARCKDVKIMEMKPEDKSKATNWLADVKVKETDEIMEDVLCYNGSEIKKSQKGLITEALIIDLSTKRQRNKKDGRANYLLYDLTNL